MADIQALCDRVIIIDRGRVSFDGRFEEVMRKFATHKVVSLTCAARVDPADVPPAVRALAEPGRNEGGGLQFKVAHSQVPALCRELLHHYSITDLAIADVSAEEVIREIFMSSRVHV